MKVFKTYEEQIEILKTRNLIIDDEEDFLESLKNLGYYNLINGYSFIFKKDDDTYKNQASSKDILSIYIFDQSLRNIVYKYAMIIESKFKSLVSYIFSKHHGENERLYLIRDNFDKDNKKEIYIARLLINCYELIKNCSDDKNSKYKKYIGHYVQNHGHVPFWVLIRAMTLGDVSVFYANMRLSEKTEVAQEFNLTPSQLEIMIKILVSFRNSIAHDERIFCKSVYKDKLPSNLSVYDIMNIKRNEAGDPLSGRYDFLALMIIFKYLLSPFDFAKFWNEFIVIRDILIKNIKSHFVAFINNEMGLKNKWINLQRCRV